ncbi:uncharacterized protein [Anabrus simplex]|uniref:uncharacterized protein n=1 Tax=Anabrus simplex TaxID=316456 RepID=UPI0035A2CB39
MAKLKELHISGFKNDDELHCVILQAIRSIGVKHTFKKCPFCKRSHVSKRMSSTTSVFRKPLDQLNAVQVKLGYGTEVEIPVFLVEACKHIEENSDVEGLFRKAGSSARQKEIKVSIEAGKKLGPQHHVIDVANILKLFLRELPDPLLPYNYHDLFLRCLVLKDRQVEAIMLTCLLLPICHLNTLAFLMKFLQKVASRADVNKMTKSNLAVVITPTVMPVEQAFNASRLNHHIRVVEHLLNNADRIGIIPELIIDKALNSGLLSTPSGKSASSEDIPKSKKKKKRRSGSLTRMINGIKKMVGKGSPDVEENNLLPSTPDYSTPCMKSAKKRKAVEPPNAFSSKKKREILQSLPQSVTLASTPCLPGAEYCLTPRVCAHPNASWTSKTPQVKQKSRGFFGSKPQSESKAAGDCRLKKTRLSLGSKKSSKKQKLRDDLVLANRGASDTSGHSDSAGHSSMEWRWSSGPWGRRRTMDSPFTSDADTSHGSYHLLPPEAEVDLSDNCVSLDTTDSDEFVRIPKSEYEAIKNRVSAIENKISEEFGNIASGGGDGDEPISVLDLVNNADDISTAEKVQNAYEKTLEESVKFDDGSTDQLARRLSRSLKIRYSGEKKVIRSPSARKIGTIRRRSKENAKPLPSPKVSRNLSWHVSTRPDIVHIMNSREPFYRNSLKRGKPNTVHSGLPQPSPLRVPDSSRIHLAFKHDQVPKSSSCSDILYSLCNQRIHDGENSSQQVKSDLLRELYSLSEGPVLRSHVRRAASFHGSELAALNRKLRNDVKRSASYMNIYHPDYNPLETKTEVDINLLEPGRSEEWQTAESYFSTKSAPDEAPVTGRESVAKLRSQNAGMVLERMRLFDAKLKPSSDDGHSRMKSSHLHDAETVRHHSRDGDGELRRGQVGSSVTSPELVKNSPKKIGSPRKRYQSPKGAHSKHKVPATTQEKPLKKSISLREKSSNSQLINKINLTAPPRYRTTGKENANSPNIQLQPNTLPLDRPVNQYSPQIAIPPNLKEIIYDVCTPKMQKVSVSPLKDCNRIDVNSPMSHFALNPVPPSSVYRTPRETPYIKKPLIVKSPTQFGRTPQKLLLSADCSNRRMVTPLRAVPYLSSVCSPTPRRHSPRLMAMQSRN